MEDRKISDEAQVLRYWVWLTLIFGAGSPQLIAYLEKYGSPESLYDALQHGRVLDLPAAQQKNQAKYSLAQAENMVEYCLKHEIELISLEDPRYPYLLRQIHVPPVLLTARGDLSLLSASPMLTVVGTRHPSQYSLDVTNVLVTELARCGIIIVSGFADGIDTAAHTAALDAGGKTVAVLGCGINVNYPHGNEKLRNRMMEQGKGLLISEYLPGVQPLPANFPKRNRILSALSEGTAVVEASKRSGSLSTADLAVEQGKFLFCVPPHDIFDKRYAGVMPLLREGALPLFSHRDVLFELYTGHPQRLKLLDIPDYQDESLVFADDILRLEDRLATESRAAKKAASAPSPKQLAISDKIPVPVSSDGPLPESEEQREIVCYLREHGDTHINDIAAALDIELSALLSAMTILELDGYVETLFGAIYRAV